MQPSNHADKTAASFLPRGWKDFGLQLAIWFGFLAVYQIARGLAGHDVSLARAHGLSVIDLENRLGNLFELTFQKAAESSHWLELAVSWTYWMSEFTVLGLALLWVYLRRNEHFRSFRNWVLLAGVIGFIGYVVYPTAPPRMFPNDGFFDMLGQLASLNHGSGVIELASNQYAAMPSLHAADALIVGVTLAYIVRHWWAKVVWLMWPGWVSFSVMATANHFWLDCLAGGFVALIAGSVIHRRRIVARLARNRAESPSHAGRRDRGDPRARRHRQRSPSPATTRPTCSSLNATRPLVGLPEGPPSPPRSLAKRRPSRDRDRDRRPARADDTAGVALLGIDLGDLEPSLTLAPAPRQ